MKKERKGKPEVKLKNIGEARGRRKAGGIYYTPPYIFNYIVENTLGEILKEKRKELDNAIKNHDCDKFLSVLKKVKAFKVLDPACGSGSFLIKVLVEFKNFYEWMKSKAKELERKIDALKREKTKGQMLFTDDKEVNELLSKYREIEKELEELKFPGTFALRHNIYGVDIDPKAIDITAFTLMVQVYDELKNGARCPTMINENLKVGNSLVSAITQEEKVGFITRKEVEKFKEEIKSIIQLREVEKSIDILDEDGLRKLIEENFDDVVEIYLYIKEKYPNAIPTHQQKLLDEWNKRAKEEPIEKTFSVLINQTGLARIFLKKVYFEKTRKIKEKIEYEINKPLIRYFNSEKKVLKDKELEEILSDEERLKEELKFIKKDRATEISLNQPPKAFNWEIEFPEVFFDDNGTLKENPGFDCVVGNPPWGRIKELPEKYEKTILSEYFRSGVYQLQKGNVNLYKLFLERSYNKLRNKGLFSMIWPATFLGESDSIPLRKEFFENNTIKTILHFPVPTVYELFDKQLIMEATVLTYKKEKQEDYEFLLKTEISIDEARNLKEIKPLKIKRSSLKNLSELYQVPIFKDMGKEWAILDKLSKYPKFGNANNGKSISDIGDREGHLHETENKDCFVNKRGDLVIREPHIRRYYVELSDKSLPPRWCNKKKFLKIKRSALRIIKSNPKLIGRAVVHREEDTKLHFTYLDDEFVLSNSVIHFILLDDSFDIKFVLGVLNSSFLNWTYKFFSHTFSVKRYEIESLPIVRASKDQQAPIISLVDAIIQKKKEYHSISQNIEDYIRFEDCEILRLDDFLKKTTDDFEIISSLKVKNDNFDELRVRVEGNEFVLEYGVRRKIEEYDEIDGGDEQREIRGKYIIDWYEVGRGKSKDVEAIEFLAKLLEEAKNFSKARQKSIWQKIAEVKIPEFNKEVRKGFLEYKSALAKARKLDEEITKIDRAIDRLVYDLYGLTEEEIKVVEKSVWGDKFDGMYKKLPSKEEAISLSNLMGKNLKMRNRDKEKVSLPEIIIRYSENKTYFYIEDLKKFLKGKYTPDNFKKTLYRLSRKKILYKAGKGWYSKIEKEFDLNIEPIKPVVELLKEKFPLLKFSVWSTEQIREYFHHLPAHFLTFIYTDKDFLSSLKDFMEDKGYIVFLNPSKKEIDKYLSLKENPFILRPGIVYRNLDKNHFKPIEQILVDLYVESKKINFLDLEEYKRILGNILLNFRINISELLDYAHNRKIKLKLRKIILDVMSTQATL